jgi:hypothetical protein
VAGTPTRDLGNVKGLCCGEEYSCTKGPRWERWHARGITSEQKREVKHGRSFRSCRMESRDCNELLRPKLNLFKILGETATKIKIRVCTMLL